MTSAAWRLHKYGEISRVTGVRPSLRADLGAGLAAGLRGMLPTRLRVTGLTVERGGVHVAIRDTYEMKCDTCGREGTAPSALAMCGLCKKPMRVVQRVSGAAPAWVTDSPEEFAQRLGLALVGLKKTSVSFGPGTVTVTYRKTPVWTVLLAIFLFPIGLLALIVKKESHGLVAVRTEGSLTEVRRSGDFEDEAWAKIQNAINAAAPA